jgi:T4-like virus tail tube protein gp19
MTMETRNSYAGGNFELRVDGHAPTAYVKSIEGGWSRAQLSDAPLGSAAHRSKQITTVEIDPITVEFGLTGAKDMLKWIQGSWNRTDHHRRNGQITYANFDMRTMFEHHFHRAVLTATTFPTLDGASKEGGYLKCKLQPEFVDTMALGTPGPRISSNVSPLQKMWTPAAFRLNIDGVDGMQYANKIDSFTVTLETQKLYSGGSRFPEIIPTKLTFPNITGTISLRYAEQLLKWHKNYIRTQDGPGTKDKEAQKWGSIELLSPDRKQTLLRVKLTDVAPVYVGVEPSRANEEQIKRVKFELYVHQMDIEGSSTLGFA